MVGDDELYDRFIREMGREDGNQREEQEEEANRERVEHRIPRNNDNRYNRLLGRLLYLDYVFMLITLPMAMYTTINVIINVITFDYTMNKDGNAVSDNDLFGKIGNYWKYIHIDDKNNAADIHALGLLGKFHVVLIHFTNSLSHVVRNYEALIKILTTTIFLSYGFIGSCIVISLNLVFILCLVITVVRQYKDFVGMLIAPFIS